MNKVIYLGNQLSKHGFTPTSVETLGERLKEKFQIIQASSKKNQLIRLLHMWWTIIKHRNASYLIIDTYSTSAFVYAWTSAKLAGWFNLPYIPILHGGNLPNKAKKDTKQIQKYFDAAHQIACPSNYLKVEMEQIVAGNYQVIPNYIDLQDYNYTAKAASLPHGIKILWVRSFHEKYNPTLAVQVLHQLIEKGYKNCELCMVGPDKDGTMAQVKQLAQQLAVDQQLKITGRLSKKEWIKLSSAYNLFINTTQVDNTPVSVMEAMALGFPVVTTNVGGIPYLFENQKEGLMVPPNNCEAFVDVIEKLYANPELADSIAKHARKKAESWDWKEIRRLWEIALS